MKSITTNDVKKQQREGVPLINVLPEESFREAHIPGSESVPVGADDFVDRVENLVGGKDKPVIVYCANKECSASPAAAKKLEQSGFTEVYDYEDGIEGWKQAGESIESGAAGARR